MEGEFIMAVAGKHGVSADTAKNILFGAGTVHKGLKYEGGSWNFENSIIGATNGGSKLSIVPEVTTLEIDGVLVPVKGLTNQKTGETATMEINLVELTPDIIKAATLGTDGVSEDETFDLIVSKGSIEEGDYFDNIAFVGLTLDGRKVIAILENALCTNGFEQEGKNKEGAVGAYTFACHADADDVEFDRLPWKIYYPKATA